MTAHKTANTRKTISAPMKYLLENNLIAIRTPFTKMLDYGCGKGFDADHFGMDKFDPHYTDGQLISAAGCLIAKNCKLYDIITCNYVLNVIESKQEQEAVIQEITVMLYSKGIAYITVRRDIVKEGVTKLGTFQENVVLDLPIIKEVKNKYCIYCLTKE